MPKTALKALDEKEGKTQELWGREPSLFNYQYNKEQAKLNHPFPQSLSPPQK
jgi:hypothetical protein